MQIRKPYRSIDAEIRPVARSRNITCNDIAPIAHHFGVSCQAAVYRSKSLRHVSAAQSQGLLGSEHHGREYLRALGQRRRRSSECLCRQLLRASWARRGAMDGKERRAPARARHGWRVRLSWRGHCARTSSPRARNLPIYRPAAGRSSSTATVSKAPAPGLCPRMWMVSPGRSPATRFMA